MEEARHFLETSTIHGLQYISSSKRFARLFWTFVVLSGFIAATAIISESFSNWEDQPIITTIETLPLAKLTLPNIIICPPKDRVTNLNFDVMESNKMVLNEKERKEIFQYALQVYQEDNHKEMMNNLSQIQEENRSFNWYHGYSEIKNPYSPYCYKSANIEHCTAQLVHNLRNSKSSGSISTKFFGEKYNMTTVRRKLFAHVSIYIPPKARENRNVTLFLQIEKYSLMKNVRDQFSYFYVSEKGSLDTNVTLYTKNITGPSTTYESNGVKYADYYTFQLDRIVSKKDMQDIKLKVMPGFRLSWYFEPMIESVGKYSDDIETKEFVR